VLRLLVPFEPGTLAPVELAGAPGDGPALTRPIAGAELDDYLL
jgi:hypothetical protein